MRRSHAGRRRLDNTRWDQSRNPYEMDHEYCTFTTIDLQPRISINAPYEPPMEDPIIIDTQPSGLEYLTSDSISARLSSRFHSAMEISESSGTVKNSETESCENQEMSVENGNSNDAAAMNYRRNRPRKRHRERNLCNRCERTMEECDGNMVQNEVQPNRERCVICSADVCDFHYRDTNLKLCQKCCPLRRPCRNQGKGCTLQDINLKMWKHELYFCFFLETCNICSQDIPIGTILQHYYSHIHPKPIKISQKFRIENRGPLEFAPHADFITFAEFGPTVCTFYLRDGLFRIGVHAPLLTTELHKYKCMVQISDPVCKKKTKYNLTVSYNDSRDWHLVCHINDVEKKDPWTGKADIKIVFSKIA